ncbi:uncharacterized protein LOC122512458 isoform X2 [Leptopilina heterotoma]|nr:uncharacterized protein LOC122512458 isoform X2 [Leptopilina heterotoma]XP_043484230.1 uncharacterized protein LOC122512458 isoform X2 [Leptopilina heterotoma]XP_043484231.1 uncharacterized protein LOC122512458 isoform X2 [Leptopilina heterotoma]
MNLVIGIIWLVLNTLLYRKIVANDILSLNDKLKIERKQPGYMISSENNGNFFEKNHPPAGGNYPNNYRYKISVNSEHSKLKARNNNYNDYRPSEAVSSDLYYNYYVNDKSYKTHKDLSKEKNAAPQLNYFRELDNMKVELRKTVNNNSLSMKENNSEYIKAGSSLNDKISSSSPSSSLSSLGNVLSQEEIRRVARQTQKQRPGILWTLFRVAFESVNETRSAISQISDLISNGIQPDPTTKKPGSGMIVLTTTEKSLTENSTSDTNATTTPAPFVLTRSFLQGLIRRNVKGLVRLFNIEWKDAINQSKVSINEFRHDLGNQIGMNLKDNPDAY